MHHRLPILPLQNLPVEVVRRTILAVMLHRKALLQVRLRIASRMGVGEAFGATVAGRMGWGVRVAAVFGDGVVGGGHGICFAFLFFLSFFDRV
jgi:hypothetical protein